MASELAITKTVDLGGGVSCRLTIGHGGAVCEWIPRMPERLTARQVKKYKNARHELAAELVGKTGKSIIIIDT